MEDMNELQMTCFEIISYVGTAKSMYINAVQKAKEGDFDAAEELIKQGDEAYKRWPRCSHGASEERGQRRA